MSRHLSPRLMSTLGGCASGARRGRRTRNRQPRRWRGQRGIVLLLALVALLLISAVGAALLFMATSESTIVGSQRLSARAFYDDLAALEETRSRMIAAIPDAQGGLNAADTQLFARVPSMPPAIGMPPLEVLYIINVANPASPANSPAGPVPGANPAQPASPTNDPLRATEVPFATTFRAVASIQPNAGDPNRSIPWSWVRINLKTELAAGQNLNFDAFFDQDPVFVYLTRQYRATDLRFYDPGTGAGSVLPPPWGPDPLAAVPPILDRPCVAVICASPVYMLTALTTIPGLQTTSRLVRAEVAMVPAFSLNAAILSQPAVTMSGISEASGRDICDPDCANLVPDLVAGGPDLIFAHSPPNTNFQSRDVTSVPAACTYVVPIQSQSPGGNSASTSATSDPYCTGPNCVCAGGKKGPSSCVQGGVPPRYDVNQLINFLRPSATVLQTPVNSYYPQTGVSNLTCDATGCTGQQLELGGFPFTDPVTQTGADPVNGTNADPIITYVPGNLKCTANCSGAGILIVDGDLELNGSMAFYGIVLVRGNVTVLGGGAPPTPCNLYGALLTGGTVSTQIGGSICFQYNTCAQRNMFSNSPLTTLSFREIPQ